MAAVWVCPLGLDAVAVFDQHGQFCACSREVGDHAGGWEAVQAALRAAKKRAREQAQAAERLRKKLKVSEEENRRLQERVAELEALNKNTVQSLATRLFGDRASPFHVMVLGDIMGISPSTNAVEEKGLTQARLDVARAFERLLSSATGGHVKFNDWAIDKIRDHSAYRGLSDENKKRKALWLLLWDRQLRYITQLRKDLLARATAPQKRKVEAFIACVRKLHQSRKAHFEELYHPATSPMWLDDALPCQGHFDQEECQQRHVLRPTSSRDALLCLRCYQLDHSLEQRDIVQWCWHWLMRLSRKHRDYQDLVTLTLKLMVTPRTCRSGPFAFGNLGVCFVPCHILGSHASPTHTLTPTTTLADAQAMLSNLVPKRVYKP